MIEQVQLIVPYGPIRKGTIVKVMNIGYDFYAIKHNGKILSVPKNLINTNPVIEEDDDDEEDEDEYYEDY